NFPLPAPSKSLDISSAKPPVVMACTGGLAVAPQGEQLAGVVVGAVGPECVEEMNRTFMSRAIAVMQLGLNLSQKLSAARSPSDAVSAYQEWLTADMSERSEVARQWMANCQKFFTDSTRILSNGGRTGA